MKEWKFLFMAVMTVVVLAFGINAKAEDAQGWSHIEIGPFGPGEFALKGDINDQVTECISFISMRRVSKPLYELIILIKGNTTRTGDEASNDELSLKRGNSVKSSISTALTKANIEVIPMGHQADKRSVDVYFRFEQIVLENVALPSESEIDKLPGVARFILGYRFFGSPAMYISGKYPRLNVRQAKFIFITAVILIALACFCFFLLFVRGVANRRNRIQEENENRKIEAIVKKTKGKMEQRLSKIIKNSQMALSQSWPSDMAGMLEAVRPIGDPSEFRDCNFCQGQITKRKLKPHWSEKCNKIPTKVRNEFNERITENKGGERK